MIGNQVTSKSGHNLGTISSDLCRFNVSLTFLCAQIGHHHPDNLALRCALRRVHCLRINVQRDPTIRMSQKLLNGLHVLTVVLQQRAEGVAEIVPADVSWKKNRSSESCRTSGIRSRFAL